MKKNINKKPKSIKKRIYQDLTKKNNSLGSLANKLDIDKTKILERLPNKK